MHTLFADRMNYVKPPCCCLQLEKQKMFPPEKSVASDKKKKTFSGSIEGLLLENRSIVLRQVPIYHYNAACYLHYKATSMKPTASSV